MSKPDLHAMGLKPQYTFDDFIIGLSNHIPAKACLEVTKAPGESYNPLFLFGGSGVGKTHLMQAVAHALLAKNPKTKIKYISAERFTNEVISAIADDNLMALRDHYSNLDLFLLDDVHDLGESKATQSEFLHIFNNLHQNNAQIIMAVMTTM